MRYFNFEEFDSPDEPGSGHNMDDTFLEMLDEARAIAGVPFAITSGFRTPAHNRKVKGTKGSSHMQGLAADIACADSYTRAIIVNALMDAGFMRIGIADTFIHCDCDTQKPEPRFWLY